MRCTVANCRFNVNNTCSNLDNLVITDTGEGIMCESYTRKREDILKDFEIYTLTVSDEIYVVVMATSYKSIISQMNIIVDELKKLYKDNIKNIIIDNTLSNGISGEGRYIQCKLDSSKLIDFQYVTSEQIKNTIREKTCYKLKTNLKMLERGVLNSLQLKMIKNGMII